MYINHLPLHDGQAIRLQGCCDGSVLDFSILARLMHNELLTVDSAEDAEFLFMPSGSEIPEGSIRAYVSQTLQTVYVPERCQIRMYRNVDTPVTNPVYGVHVWQLSVICACVAALFRGKPAMLMHCAMLERGGDALLLCGESGIGKSTSSRRWRADGGSAVADDMVLLEFTEDAGILVHRLPTWSACRISLEGKSYPFNPPLRLKRVLALTRSSDGEESIRPVSMAEYFAQIYRCAFFHYKAVMTKLPPECCQPGAMRLRELTDRLIANCPPEALFASLNGDIHLTLKDYL